MTKDSIFHPFDGIEGVWTRRCVKYPDERGYFMPIIRPEDFIGQDLNFVQASISFSNPHVFRGFHLQIDQWQLITVIQGRIRDIFIDIDSKSKSFGKIGELALEDGKVNQLLIAPNIAHGYIVGNEAVTISYSHTNIYDQTREIGVNYASPEFSDTHLGITSTTIISKRDQSLQNFQEASQSFRNLSNKIELSHVKY